MLKPELAAPAGDMEKLRTALDYGADAVYLGGVAYSLRAATNFDKTGIKSAIEYAHSRNSKAYVAVNIYARNSDIKGLSDYFAFLQECGADAVIISDVGVFSLAREYAPNIPIHISTQANVTNQKAAAFWKNLGAKRIILARELSLNEIIEIKEKTDIELEVFVHGAMCMAYSGRCLLSNYLNFRDSNKGFCWHPCRFEYSLCEKSRMGEYFPLEEDDRGAYILSSKDLCMIEHIDKLILAGISSFKIEGRMKTEHYVAVTSKTYREAIDDYFKDKNLYESKKTDYLSELYKTDTRGFTTGFFYGAPKEGEMFYHGRKPKTYDFAGIVLEYDDNTAKIQCRNKISAGDTLEFISPYKKVFSQKITHLSDINGNSIATAPHVKQVVYIKTEEKVHNGDIIRVLR